MMRLDSDMKSFIESELNQLCMDMDFDATSILPKRTEIFVEKVIKDDAGGNITNEKVHKMMHRFRRKAKERGFRRFLILGSFAMGKTEQCCVGLCLYEIARNPNILIKIVHVSEKEAVNRVRAIAEYIKNDEDFKRLAPHIQPTSIWGQEKFIVKRKTISKDPTCQAFSVLSSSLGGRSHLIIYDDINDLKSAVLEPTTRENIEKMVRNVWGTRGIPGNSEEVALLNVWHNSSKYAELLTKKGRVKRMSLIKEGEEVLTSDGFVKVIKRSKNKYKGEIVKIIPHYFTALKAEFTSEHKILTSNGWVEAENLSKKDYLVVPIYSPKGNWLKKVLKTFDNVGITYKKKIINTNIKISKKELKERIDSGITYKNIGKEYGVSAASIYNLCRLYDVSRTRFNNIDKSIFEDNQFWKILGYWIAEGSFTFSSKKYSRRDVIRFTFGSHETEYLNEVTNFFNKYGIHVGSDYTIRNSCNLKISCRQLAEWIKTNFDEFEHNKRLPHWFFMLPKDKFFKFLEGYSNGDGCITNNGEIHLCSVSKHLLLGIQLNLLRFGIVSRLSKGKKAGRHEVDFGFGKTTINCRVSYSLYYFIGKRKYKFGYIEDNSLYVRVKEIEKNYFDGFVYDVATPPVSNFTVPGFIAHNSDISNYMRNDPSWAWMTIAVSEDKSHLIYTDSFGMKKDIPLWSKYNKKILEEKHRSMGDRDYNRAYRLIPYSDEDKSFPSFESCCRYGIKPANLISDLRDWIFCCGIDFSGPKREGTILIVGALNKHTGVKIPVELYALSQAAKLSEIIVDVWKRFGVEIFLAENNAVQGTIIDLLQTDLDKGKFRRYNINIDGFNTGRNKADPNEGLPALQKEMEKREWFFAFEKQYTDADEAHKDLWCRFYNEMKFHPFYGRDDFVLGLWFCRAAFKRALGKSGTSMIY